MPARHSSSGGRKAAASIVVALGLLAAPLAAPLAAQVTTSRPEDVGMSSERLRRVGELMQRHIDARTFTGAVTLVARHGRVVQHDAYGVMDLDTKRPMPKDAVFRIMSMTKPVVGVSVLMLVEEGRVRLTDPVSRFVPELKGLNAAVLNGEGRAAPAPSGAVTAPPPYRIVAAEREITVRDLLTHTSGLMSGGPSAAQARDIAPKAGETLAQVMPRLKGAPLDFQPGSRWAYSAQYGFDLLARIVEVAGGMPFDRFARERIFDPLGMKDTSFYPSEGNPRIVTLYQHVDGELRKQPNPPFMNGAYFSGGGGLLSTAQDYLQFALMLANRGQLGGKRLLGSQSVDLMTTMFARDTLPGRLAGEGFGLSVRVVDDPGARNTYLSRGSFGWSGAYNTYFFIDPRQEVVAIFMTQVANLETRGEVRNDFDTAVMQAIVGMPAAGTN